MPGCKLWLTTTNGSCKRGKIFICLFLHTGRGLYYGSYLFTHTWIIGAVIILMVMATAVLGYVLPGGHISFWGATVITNLFSAIPYLGGDLVTWLWGGFAADKATLTYIVLFRCFLYCFSFNINYKKGVFYSHTLLVVSFSLGRLLSVSATIYVSFNLFLGITPKPLLAATMVSPELSIKPELVHARIHAVLTNWPEIYGSISKDCMKSRMY